MTPEEWRDEQSDMLLRRSRESARLSAALDTVEMPDVSQLRPARSDDIVEDAVIYYPNNDPPHWKIVEDVRDPSDDFKAYVAYDGCCYGLFRAMVRRGEPA